MLYGTLEQFITLTLSNGWAGRKANMGMKKDEVLSGIATFKYQNKPKGILKIHSIHTYIHTYILNYYKKKTKIKPFSIVLF